MISWILSGPFFDHDLHRTGVAKSVTRDQGILDMFVETIVFEIRDAGNTALCVFGIGFIDTGLGDHQDLSVRGNAGLP